MVECWVLVVMFIAGYWKCITAMGPTLDANFCCGYVSLLCTGPMELKTPTLSVRCIYWFIYCLQLGKHGDMRRYLWIIDTVTNGRNRYKQKTQWEGNSKERTPWISPSCLICLIKKPGLHLLRWHPRVPHFYIKMKGADQDMGNERAVIGSFQKTGLVRKWRYGCLVCSQTADNLIRDWMVVIEWGFCLIGLG